MRYISKESLEKYMIQGNHTRQETAEFFHVKTYVIDNLIREYGCRKKSVEEILKELKQGELSKEFLTQNYGTEGFSYSDICNRFNLKPGYLDLLLKEYGLGKRSIVKRLKESYTKEELEDLYFTQNLTISEICEKLQTGYLNIRKLFKQYGIPSKDKELVQKNIEKTMMDRYGTKNIRQSEYFKKKSAEVKLERYGDPNYHNVEQMNVTVALKGRLYKSVDSVPNNEFSQLLEEFNIPFEREFPLGRFRYDFKVGNTLIEINPSATHNSTWGINGGEGKDPKYHLEKSSVASEAGFTCMHVWDWDDTKKVVRMLLPKKRLYARKCNIREIQQSDANKFLQEYHLQGRAKMQIVCLALFVGDELMQVMTFGKPRFNKNFQWELIRLCTKAGYLVVGGAERLFKYFIENYKPESVISYCDASKFKGNVYVNLGFQLKSSGVPSRHWYELKTGRQLTDNGVRMLGFDKLCNANYGKGTSNDELLRKHGWVEIWDAGQAVYIWKA